MTLKELEELKELAGINEPKSPAEINKEWANVQITNIPKVKNQIPIPTLGNFKINNIYDNNKCDDKEIEKLMSRLNSQLGSDFVKTVKIKRL